MGEKTCRSCGSWFVTGEKRESTESRQRVRKEWKRIKKGAETTWKTRLGGGDPLGRDEAFESGNEGSGEKERRRRKVITKREVKGRKNQLKGERATDIGEMGGVRRIKHNLSRFPPKQRKTWD